MIGVIAAIGIGAALIAHALHRIADELATMNRAAPDPAKDMK